MKKDHIFNCCWNTCLQKHLYQTIRFGGVFWWRRGLGGIGVFWVWGVYSPKTLGNIHPKTLQNTTAEQGLTRFWHRNVTRVTRLILWRACIANCINERDQQNGKKAGWSTYCNYPLPWIKAWSCSTTVPAAVVCRFHHSGLPLSIPDDVLLYLQCRTWVTHCATTGTQRDRLFCRSEERRVGKEC